MITEQLYSQQFINLERAFLRWLQTLNYSRSTIETRKRNIREFLLYLERCDVMVVEELNRDKVQRYVRYLKRRENKIFGSGLKNATVNVGISTVNKFFEYLTVRQAGLRQSEKAAFIPDQLKHLKQTITPKNILTLSEIDLLYEATFQEDNNTDKKYSLQGDLSMRDRAMLGIYYGCGLRKSEGTALKLSDVQVERKLICVRQGKGNKQRYVPVTGVNLKYITEYLQSGREQLLLRSVSDTPSNSFFISAYGTVCSDQALSSRFKKLVELTQNSPLQSKKPSLHTLRHSIATHLLAGGMQIELIQQFLGHASLESTQLYTHIVNEL